MNVSPPITTWFFAFSCACPSCATFAGILHMDCNKAVPLRTNKRQNDSGNGREQRRQSILSNVSAKSSRSNTLLEVNSSRDTQRTLEVGAVSIMDLCGIIHVLKSFWSKGRSVRKRCAWPIRFITSLEFTDGRLVKREARFYVKSGHLGLSGKSDVHFTNAKEKWDGWPPKLLVAALNLTQAFRPNTSSKREVAFESVDVPMVKKTKTAEDSRAVRGNGVLRSKWRNPFIIAAGSTTKG